MFRIQPTSDAGNVPVIPATTGAPTTVQAGRGMRAPAHPILSVLQGRRPQTGSFGSSERGELGISAEAAPARVFRGSTRASQGFNEVHMYATFSQCPEAVTLEQAVGRMGFRYVGDTGSASKANTDFTSREIRINANLTSDLAALSFAYELANASQNEEFRCGPLRLWKEGGNDLPTAQRYAQGVLYREARSVLMRSTVAIAIGRQDGEQFEIQQHCTGSGAIGHTKGRGHLPRNERERQGTSRHRQGLRPLRESVSGTQEGQVSSGRTS